MNINLSYAWSQLLATHRDARAHEDPEVRANAARRAKSWAAVLEGMQRGELDIGSRTPTRAPWWVTLEVMTGGFATGEYAAGGALREHELVLAEQRKLPPSRLALNLHFLQSSETLELLRSGAYRLEVPEEAALLVVAWLRHQGKEQEATNLVYTLAPWFRELRFFPIPAAPAPSVEAGVVWMQDCAATIDELAKTRQQPRVQCMQQALQVWAPLHDRAIELALATVDGEPPRLIEGKLGGGQVGQHFPPRWERNVAELSAALARAGAPTTARARTTALLIAALARCASSPGPMPAADAHLLRRAVARHVSAHGVPGTPEHQAWRAQALQAVAAPLHGDLRAVAILRLRKLHAAGGLDLERASAPVTEPEHVERGLSEGCMLPPSVVRKLARSWAAPIETLAEYGAIPSAESMHVLMRRLTAQVYTLSFTDPALRQLCSALYIAFRNRRSLLLTGYKHQVQFQELPWAAALLKAQAPDEQARAQAWSMVRRASATLLKTFPQTLIPNKVTKELSALCAEAGLELPLTEELAADIFMGSFSPKVQKAAKRAAEFLRGTLYQRYYDIAPEEIRELTLQNQLANSLAALCMARVREEATGTAYHGQILEQCQILTTHNLAVLFQALELRESLGASLGELAGRCWSAVVKQLQTPAPRRRQLHQRKNVAYTWRQMVFFLSLSHDAEAALCAMRTNLSDLSPTLQTQLSPALHGLELAAAGIGSSDPAFEAAGARVLTGWIAR